MKTFQTLISVLFLGLALSVSAQKVTKEVDVEKSSLIWKGHKIGGSHEGTITLKKGTLYFEKDKLIKGDFTADMSSISSTDLSGKGKERLDAHLKSEDFFDVEKYTEATLVFTKIREVSKNVYNITSDLMIKGIKQEVNFDLTVTKNEASTSFEVDRTKFDIKYRSGTIFPELADKAIKDNFDIIVKLVF